MWERTLVYPVPFLGSRHRFNHLHRRIFMAAAVIAAILSASLMMTHGQGDIRSYFTKVGEVRAITLSDDRRIILNTNTAVSIRSAGPTVEVTVLKGEVHFSLPYRAKRILTVSADGLHITGSGTAFDVRKPTTGPVAVAVEEGTLTLRIYADRATKNPIVVRAGQIAAYESDALAVRWVGREGIEREVTWAAGR
jgi:ferric-dicitrate binding protein FerR (iron transport regulator)